MAPIIYVHDVSQLWSYRVELRHEFELECKEGYLAQRSKLVITRVLAWLASPRFEDALIIVLVDDAICNAFFVDKLSFTLWCESRWSFFSYVYNVISSSLKTSRNLIRMDSRVYGVAVLKPGNLPGTACSPEFSRFGCPQVLVPGPELAGSRSPAHTRT